MDAQLFACHRRHNAGRGGRHRGNFALSFLVFDETGSTLAAAALIALEVLPQFVIPLLVSPMMDRLPRKPFLVGGDAVNALLYALMGVYLLNYQFHYVGYLLFSLVLASLGAFDLLAYNSIYPKLIPPGMEEKGYTVSGMIYPVMQVVMAPLAAVLYDLIGVGNILLIQSGLSLAAAVIESRIRVTEETRRGEHGFSMRQWWEDVRETAAYLRQEKGLQSMYLYSATTNGVGNAYSPILVAFFRSTPGFSLAMYSLFSVAEFAGRTIGGLFHYNLKMPPKKRFSFAFMVYMVYETCDMLLLWLPYPLMLANRAACGFLGINSATMRYAAVQRYIPEEQRARINAFEGMLFALFASVLALAVGALGDLIDRRLCLTLCGAFSMLVCLATIWRRRKDVRAVYEREAEESGADGARA